MQVHPHHQHDCMPRSSNMCGCHCACALCAFHQIMNMKPPEILSLLEEASGTKMYERKKDSAMSTLAKKQTRLEEIDEVCACVWVVWPPSAL